MVWAQFHSSVSGCPVAPVPFAERLPLPPSSGLGVPVEDHMTRVRVDSGSRFHSTASVCQHRTLGDCGLIVSFRIRESESSSFVPLHDCFAVQGPPRPVWISACAFLHLKKRGWDVDRDGTGGADVFTEPRLPVRGHGVGFHLAAPLRPISRVRGFQCVSPPWLRLFLSILLFLMLL